MWVQAAPVTASGVRVQLKPWAVEQSVHAITINKAINSSARPLGIPGTRQGTCFHYNNKQIHEMNAQLYVITLKLA